jgi:hypothetical protein
MNPASRRLALPLAVAALLAVALLAVGSRSTPLAAAAPAAGTLTSVLRAGEAVARSCSTRQLDAGSGGVALESYRASTRGALTARLDGVPGSDWDLAVFDRTTGESLGASAHFDAVERVTVFLGTGQEAVLQACRRSGSAGSVPLALDFTPVAASSEPAERISLVRVGASGPGDVRTLNDLGLDVTHNATDGGVDVAIYSDAQRRALAATGLPTQVRIADLPAADGRARAREADAGRSTLGSTRAALPSGRTTYRQPADYAEDLKKLVAAYPGHVRPVTMAVRSLEGRPIEGVEIASDVNAVGDGRPTFLLAGLTHAREWPSGEVSIEFAIDMARTFAAGSDPRVDRLVRSTRTLVFPLLNPDGFEVSRTAGTGFDGGDDRPSETTLPEAVTDANAYKRKNCRPPNLQDTRPCAVRTGFGVDLNRAYGAFWGGAGSSSDMTTQQYRGTNPFSEPEAQAIRALGAGRQIQTFVTNHTFTDVGRFLRQPGFKIPNDPVPDVVQDEARMSKLGAAMADATGYVSELGYATLGNITGPSDDFLYYSQGTFGYTPELRGANFHTDYATAVAGEYSGDQNHAGRGLREAFMLAGEQAADVTDHAVLRGSAPPGRILRLRKTTQLQTSDDENGDGTKDKQAMIFDETLDTTLTVGPSGRYEWHVNPSTRPLLGTAKENFTFTCETPDGTVIARRAVVIDRGQQADIDPCTPVPPAPSGAATVTVARVTLSIRRPAFSARRTTRRHPIGVYLRVRGGGLRLVRVRFVDGRNRTVLAASRVMLKGSGRVGLKLRRRIRPGTLRVVVTARDAASRPVRATARVRVKR